MSEPNPAPATFAMRKKNAPLPSTTERITIKSKKVAPPPKPPTLPSERAPSYTDSLENSDEEDDREKAAAPAPTSQAGSNAPSGRTSGECGSDGLVDDACAYNEAEADADDYYVLRERPTVTVAERVERLRAAHAGALQERAVEELPTRGVARRPATLVRTRHGTVRSLGIAGRPARESGNDGGDGPRLAIQGRPSNEAAKAGTRGSLSSSSSTSSHADESDKTTEDAHDATEPADAHDSVSPQESHDAAPEAPHAESAGAHELPPPLEIDRDEVEQEEDGI